jgi:hypothetical protein
MLGSTQWHPLVTSPVYSLLRSFGAREPFDSGHTFRLAFFAAALFSLNPLGFKYLRLLGLVLPFFANTRKILSGAHLALPITPLSPYGMGFHQPSGKAAPICTAKDRSGHATLQRGETQLIEMCQ